jgi:probable HAF family extracellular repeat protein
MTLNITVLSPGGIHQSADFQISETERDADGNWIVLQENASKIIALHFARWSGLLTYCGMGLWNGLRTDQYASGWLSHIGREAEFHDVLETVRREGSVWIGQINQALGKIKPHSFTMAGFEWGTLRYAMASNYQTLNGNIHPLAKDLQVDVRSTTGVHVVVTGIRTAVAEESQRLLKHMAESGEDHAVIQHRLADINRKAARSPEAKNGISESCLTYTCSPSGQQWSKVNGDVEGPINPLTVDGENQLSTMLAEILRQNPNAKQVQSAYSTSAAQQTDIKEHIDCRLRFRSGFAEHERSAIAKIEEFGEINQYSLDAKAINRSNVIVGNIRVLPDATPRAFLRRPDGEILYLGSFGGALGYATDLNDGYQVVGNAGVDGPGMHAFVWSEDSGLCDLGSLGGRNSGATSINNNGVVVGTSGCHPGEPKAYDESAFIWTPGTKMVALDPEFDGWSRAYAINNRGWVIGWRGHGSVYFGFVWAPSFGFIDLAVGPGKPFYVCAINDSGLVIGEGDDEMGKRRPYCWTLETGIRQLKTEELFHPCRVDSRGFIIGGVWGSACPWNRPFIYTPAEELLPLPYADDHHTDVAAINSDCTIVGSARRSGSWRHLHPLIWRLHPHAAQLDR